MEVIENKVDPVACCPTCGNPFLGKFCASCGEKQVSKHDFEARHFVEEGVEGITHFDNKFFRSIRDLFLKPGMLTLNFEAGRKVPFMKPVQLFIVCNLIFFLIVGGSNIFALNLNSYLSNSRGGLFNTREYFLQKFGADADLNALKLLFQEKMTSKSKTFIFLFIPFFAIACGVFFFQKKKGFGLHLAFATHFFSFLLLFFTLFYLLIELPNEWFFHAGEGTFNSFATTFNLTALVVYFTIAAHRFYRIKWLWALGSGIFAGFLFILLLQVYRIFLFYNIMRGMD